MAPAHWAGPCPSPRTEGSRLACLSPRRHAALGTPPPPPPPPCDPPRFRPRTAARLTSTPRQAPGLRTLARPRSHSSPAPCFAGTQHSAPPPGPACRRPAHTYPSGRTYSPHSTTNTGRVACLVAPCLAEDGDQSPRRPPSTPPAADDHPSDVNISPPRRRLPVPPAGPARRGRAPPCGLTRPGPPPPCLLRCELHRGLSTCPRATPLPGRSPRFRRQASPFSTYSRLPCPTPRLPCPAPS